MYTLEYITSKGRASEYMYHKDIIDYYMIYKDNKRIFCENENWKDYCLLLEIDNLNKDISIKKQFAVFINNIAEVATIGCYDCRDFDYMSIKDELLVYMDEIKNMLDILDYKIRL